MIKLEMDDYCQECPNCEPKCVKFYYGDGNCTTSISCENRGMCTNVKLYIEQQQIRCKDCNHNTNPPESGNANCDLFYGMTEQYGFCHKAERRTNNGYSSVPC